MKFLITMPQGSNFDRYFPKEQLDRLEKYGSVTLNNKKEQFSKEELFCLLPDTDIILTHWGAKQLTGELLDHAPRLKLIAHCAGSVAQYASEESYKRSIPTLSANPIMAKYVAEWVLGSIISGLREFSILDGDMKNGIWKKNNDTARSLFDISVGLVGLGTVGRYLLDMLTPFGCRVTVYDPYISEADLEKWSFARLGSFDEALQNDVVSLHASKTPETYHMINAEALSKMPDGCLFVNSARAALVDTEALICELCSGRISAVIDVFDHEGKAQDKRLIECRNALLMPHSAALPARSGMTAAVIDDIERFIGGEPLRLTVSYSQFIRMTQE